jgi:hypothetical protein
MWLDWVENSAPVIPLIFGFIGFTKFRDLQVAYPLIAMILQSIAMLCIA